MGGKIVQGDESVTASCVMPTDRATAGSLTFVSRPEYLSHLKDTAAAIALVGPDVSPQCPSTLVIIQVEDPYQAFALAARALAPERPRPNGVHPTAVVDSSATLGKDIAVGPHCVIGARAAIGDRAVLHAGVHVHEDCQVGADTELFDNVVVRHQCKIGSQCVLHPGVVVGADGFGYAPTNTEPPEHLKIPQTGIVVIEDNVEIGANSCVDRATLGETRIGRGTKIDNLVQVAHNVVIGPGSILVAQAGVAGSAALGAGVTLGAQVGISGHLNVGDGATVFGQSGVMQDIAAGDEMMGSPATHKGEHLRTVVLLRRLPELMRRVLRLERKLDDTQE